MGNDNVGKSAILNQYIDQHFRSDYIQSGGLPDVSYQNMKIDDFEEETKC